MVVDFDDKSAPRVRPFKLAHVVLRTRDKNAMTTFYQDFFAGTSTHEADFISFITYDNEHHRIAIAQVPNLKAKDAETCGLEHIAFTFKTLEDLFLAYRQRRSKGILPFWCINHGVTISLYYYDPDGDVLETQYDCFEDSHDATKYMLSADFGTDPIGVDFDPEEFIERIKKGEKLSSLTKRPDIGPRGLDTVPTVKAQPML